MQLPAFQLMDISDKKESGEGKENIENENSNSAPDFSPPESIMPNIEVHASTAIATPFQLKKAEAGEAESETPTHIYQFAMGDAGSAPEQPNLGDHTGAVKPNNTGLPTQLKSGV